MILFSCILLQNSNPMTKIRKKYEVRACQQLSAPHLEHNQQIMSAKINVLSSPSRNRATGMTSMHEVKSGIFLSDIKGGAGDVNRKKTMKVVRTKSGNFKKAMESELDGEKDFAGDAGTRVTSSYARVLLAGSGFLADAVCWNTKQSFPYNVCISHVFFVNISTICL